MNITGLDPYAISQRQIVVTFDDAHVVLSVEGGEGRGQAMLTPDQADALARSLTRCASATRSRFDDDQPAAPA